MTDPTRDALREAAEALLGTVTGGHSMHPEPVKGCVVCDLRAALATPDHAPDLAAMHERNRARSRGEDASGGYREIAGCGCEECQRLATPDPAPDDVELREAVLAEHDAMSKKHGESCDCDVCLALQRLADAALATPDPAPEHRSSFDGSVIPPERMKLMTDPER